MIKFLKFLVYSLIAVYFIAAIGLYIKQDQIFFRPHKLSENHRFRKGQELEIKVDEGVYLNVLKVPGQNTKGAVLYLHGNKGNIKRCIYQSDRLGLSDYDIYIPDYRSYGKSDGNLINEQQMLNDAQIIYNHITQSHAESMIHLIGYSMGTGMASWLAAHNEPANVVLISPFISLAYMKDLFAPVFPDVLLKFKFRNDENIASIQCPITLIHGTGDQLIPFECSQQLQQIAGEKSRLISIPGASHRGTILSDRLSGILEEIL